MNIWLQIGIATAISVLLGILLNRSSLPLKKKILLGIVIVWNWLCVLSFRLENLGLLSLLPRNFIFPGIMFPMDFLNVHNLSDVPFFMMFLSGIQLMPMLSVGLIRMKSIESAQTQADKNTATTITFLAAGLLFFITPQLVHFLFSSIDSFLFPVQREMAGMGVIMDEIIFSFFLILATAATTESENPLRTFLKAILVSLVLLIGFNIFIKIVYS
jgi:hypothetical protein